MANATMADMEPEVPPPRPDLVLEWLDLLGGQTPPSPCKNLEYLSLGRPATRNDPGTIIDM